MISKEKIKKIISAFLVTSIMIPSILFSFPQKTNAFWGIFDFGVDTDPLNATINTTTATTSTVNTSVNTTSLGMKIKDAAKEILKEVAKAVARRALQEMTKSTVNWINSGFHGQPLFLENPNSFFEDIAKSEVKNMVDEFGYDSLKYPFGKDFALNAINSYKSQLEDNTAYSLSKVIQDPVLLRSYQNDFNVGGWNGFLINTQYPQNNYLGFQMTATEELARRVQGTGQNAAAKVQTLLQQGQGFLSPQTCPSNPDYNNGTNEWNRPRFDQATFDKAHVNDSPTSYALALQAARAEWDEKNTCPGGLVNTTPGSVISNQITTALNIPMNSTLQAMGLGNSISMIFDALLNKFIGDGLNSLASEINSEEDPDTWSYDGQTLGSPTDGGINSTWDTGPGEPIYINKFIKDIENGIANTEKELELIAGILDNLSNIWPKIRTLDVCLPGPDIGWEQRLEDQKNRAENRVHGASSGESDSKMEEGGQVLKELKFAVSFFKDWMINRMIEELPSSILFMDAVKGVEDLSQQSKELIDAKRLKTQALSRLNAIQGSLNGIIELDDEGNAIQPEPNSFEEEILIQLKKQYDATRVSISNTIILDTRQDEFFVTEEKLKNLDDLALKCEEERIEKGWPNPAGLTINPEQAYFCDLPIIGGYTHGAFLGTTLTHPELPMVNAKKVMKYKIRTIGSMLSFSKKTVWVNINLKCNSIYNANLLDYKGDMPGPTNITETYMPPFPDLGDGGIVGVCEFDGETEIEVQEDVAQDYCEENGGTFTPNETP